VVVKLAAYLGRLSSAQVTAVAERAGREAEVALARAGVEGLAAHLADSERVAALFDGLDPETRRVAYRLAVMPGSEAPVALLVHILGQGSEVPRARAEAAIRALCAADLAFWVRPDAVAIPEEFLPGVVRVLERLAVRLVAEHDVPPQAVRERPPARAVADLARLLGRLRLGAATTRTGRVARREQDRLAAYVESGGEGPGAIMGSDLALAPAWEGYDARLAPWLAVAALYGLVGVERSRGLVSSPKAERFLAQEAAWQWERVAEAWLHLMRRHSAGLRVLSPDFIVSLPEGGWLDLEAAAEEYGRAAADPWGLTPRALLRLIAATGYRLGTLRLAKRGETGTGGEPPLPLAAPTAAMRAFAEHGQPRVAPGEGRLHVDANMEVVAMGDLPARLWADLALWAQPRTLDRASVWRLTPASVGAAAAAGWRVTQLLAALAEAAAGGVPQAMEVRLREWGDAAAAEVRLRTVVRLGEGGDRARLEALLARMGLEPVGEGLFLADPARHAEVVRALHAEHVRVRADEAAPFPLSAQSGGGRRLDMPWPGPFQERLPLSFPGGGRSRSR
jgi:hypothetical protein